MGTRPYKLINRTERADLASRLTHGLQLWAQEYAAVDAEVECELIGTAESPHEWMVGSLPPGTAVAIGLGAAWVQSLARLVLTGRPAATLDRAGAELLGEVGRELLQQAGQSAFDALGLKPSASDSPGSKASGRPALVWKTESELPLPAAGEAFVLARCRIGEQFDFYLALWPATVLACLTMAPVARAARLEPLSKAIEAEPLVLDAIAGEAVLAFRELTTLAVGDVLKLDRRITQPIALHVRGGSAVCSARLGATQGRAALQLIHEQT